MQNDPIQPSEQPAPKTPEPQGYPAPAPIISSAPETSEPPRSKKKLLTLIIIIAAALVVLVGGGVAAYNLWYQNPDKVIGDALGNALSAKSIAFKGSAEIDAEGGKTVLALEGAGNDQLASFDGSVKVDIEGEDLEIKGTIISTVDNEVYVKVSNAREIVDRYFDAVEENAGISVDSSAFDDLVDKVHNKWVKIESKDLDQISEEYSRTQECVGEAFGKLSRDKAVKDEIGKLYETNRFILVKEKLGSKSIDGVGSLGYRLDFDDEKAKAFATGFNETALGKSLIDCDESYKLNASDVGFDDEDMNYEVWVSRFGHEVTQVNINGTDSTGTDGTLTVNFGFNMPLTVEEPTDFATFKELQSDFNAALEEFYMTLYAAYL